VHTDDGEERTYLVKTHIYSGESHEVLFITGEIRYLNIMGDWIYFRRELFNDENKMESGIYRMRTDGSDLERLPTEHTTVYNISVVGDWIYYRELIQDIRASSINRIHVESMAIEQIVAYDDVFITCFHVVDGWVYYGKVTSWTHVLRLNNGGWWIYRIRPDGTDGSRISTYGVDYHHFDEMFFDVVDNWVYFLDTALYSIFRMRLDGTEQQLITDRSDGRVGSHNIFDGWIYYNNFNPQPNGGLYRVTIDGRQTERIGDGQAFYISVVDGWIYHRTTRSLRLSALFPTMRIRMDGTDREVLSQGHL
jgi:hypothetical protein